MSGNAIATDRRLTVFFDGDCGFCAWCASTLDRLDWRGRLRMIPYQQRGPETGASPSSAALARNLHVRDHAGRWERGGAACLRVAAQVPLLWPLAALGRLPGLRSVLDRGYRLVARNRHRIGKALGLAGCTYSARPTQ